MGHARLDEQWCLKFKIGVLGWWRNELNHFRGI